MDNNNNRLYFDIVLKGKQFMSAMERYGSDMQIICDRCQNSPITQGYGLNSYDMCLPCVNKVKKIMQVVDDEHSKINKDINCTRMCQIQFTTNMLQNQYNPTDRLTFMLQTQYKPQSINIDNIQGFGDIGNKYSSLESQFMPLYTNPSA